MDFFEAQEAARKRSTRLVVLFLAAVLAIIAVVYAVVHVAIGPGAGPIDVFLLVQVALAVGLVIATGSAIRTAGLRRGGPAVAELLGARRVASDTTDPEERRLLNVVEEMSIASGVPVPAVYIMDREDGINAFAAGHTTHDAAVAVTRGALRSLTRDELQGVMAHEFSHILNGDMRLNIRLMGLLYGILLLAVIGRGIVYAGPRGRSREGGAGWIVILGLVLLLVGYVGVFFGKLIQAAVSRQREYLADSAAVQFTRNPDGLAGALKKIGGADSGSRVANYHAEELSHFFFASGLRGAFFGLLATHPPLDERIRRLEPGWQAQSGRGDGAGGDHARVAARHGFEAATAGLAGSGSRGPAPDLVASVGAPTPEHIAYAGALLGSLHPELSRAAHEPLGAKALIFALVLSGSPSAPRGWRDIVAGYGLPELPDRVDDLVPLVRAGGANARLALLDLALPTLRTLSPEEAERFRATTRHLALSDERIQLFEFALIHTLARHLRAADGRARPDSTTPLSGAAGEAELVLSAVAWVGSGGRPDAAEQAFASGAARLAGANARLRLRDRGDGHLASLDAALERLEHVAPEGKRRFLEACAAAAAHDGKLEPSEAELLRAIGEALDCPIPPILPAA
jgi:Zn-dependent protease with chaperone function